MDTQTPPPIAAPPPELQPDQSFPEPMKKPTVVIVGVVVILILLAVGAVFLHFSHSSTSPNTTAPSIAPIKTEPNQTAYNTQWFAVSSPKVWKDVGQNYIGDPGTFLQLQPPVNAPGETANVAIEVMDPGQASIASMSAGFEFLGFKKEEASVAGVPADKFQGYIQLSGKVIRNTNYLFTNNGKIYLAKLSYNTVAVDSQLESEFAQFMTTFSFN